MKSNTLGGHANRTWVDEGALRFLIARFGIKSFLDIGCGPGGMVRKAMELGLDATGIDGDATLDFIGLNVIIHDFYAGPPPLTREYDLGWCVEFLEHIDEKYLPNVIEAFRHCKYLVCTASQVKGKNRYHVNVHTTPWWIMKMQDNGFRDDSNVNGALKVASTMGHTPGRHESFLQETGVFYYNDAGCPCR